MGNALWTGARLRDVLRDAGMKSGAVQVQFQGITKSGDVGEFKDVSHQVVITPADYASGKLIYPYEAAKK